jgi:hypothetical protein
MLRDGIHSTVAQRMYLKLDYMYVTLFVIFVLNEWLNSNSISGGGDSIWGDTKKLQ